MAEAAPLETNLPELIEVAKGFADIFVQTFDLRGCLVDIDGPPRTFFFGGGENGLEEGLVGSVVAGKDLSERPEGLEAVFRIERAAGGEGPVEFEISEGRGHHRGTNVFSPSDIIARDIESFSPQENVFHEGFEGGGRGGVAEDKIFQWDAIIPRGEDFAVCGLAIATGPA